MKVGAVADGKSGVTSVKKGDIGRTNLTRKTETGGGGRGGEVGGGGGEEEGGGRRHGLGLRMTTNKRRNKMNWKEERRG